MDSTMYLDKLNTKYKFMENYYFVIINGAPTKVLSLTDLLKDLIGSSDAKDELVSLLNCKTFKEFLNEFGSYLKGVRQVRTFSGKRVECTYKDTYTNNYVEATEIFFIKRKALRKIGVDTSKYTLEKDILYYDMFVPSNMREKKLKYSFGKGYKPRRFDVSLDDEEQIVVSSIATIITFAGLLTCLIMLFT